MSYKYRFQEGENLLVIVFEGLISYEEEVQAVLDTLADPQMRPNARILVDKSRAQMMLGTEHVEPHIDLILQNLARFGEPKVANVVSRDVDFGKVRMFELRAEGRIPHDFMVFRTVEEACAWLGVDPAAIDWP
jgi:hypothetical protein